MVLNPFARADLHRHCASAIWALERGAAIVGREGAVLRLGADGTSTELGTLKAGVARGVWAVSKDDFVVVGGNGSESARHYDGRSWRSVVLPEHGDLFALWGRNAGDLYIAASNALLHCRTPTL